MTDNTAPTGQSKAAAATAASKNREVDTGKPSPKGATPETPKASYERDGNQLVTALNLLRYLWPSDKPRLRMLFVFTVLAILLGQMFLAVTPLVFATVVDAVGGEGVFPTASIALIIGLVTAFGLARLLAQG